MQEEKEGCKKRNALTVKRWYTHNYNF